VRLTQVFINLLDNALQVHRSRCRVRLTVERDGQQVVVTVEDNGLGVSADMLPSISDMLPAPITRWSESRADLGSD